MGHWFDYSPHRHFVMPAAERCEVWRLVLGVLLTVVAVAALGQVYGSFVFGLLEGLGLLMDGETLGQGNTPITVLILLSGYGTVAIAVFGVLWILHERTIRSVFGPGRAMRTQFVMVLLGLVVLNLMIEVLPPWNYNEPLVRNLDCGPWLRVVPFALMAILIQTGAEEVLFRGYIQQQLGARFNSPLIWMLMPSLLFGALHYDPDATGANAWYGMIWAVLFGMAAADLTARSGTLGPAIALHFANNVMALMFVALPDGLPGLALFTTPFDSTDTEIIRSWLWVDLGFLGVSWFAARLALQR